MDDPVLESEEEEEADEGVKKKRTESGRVQVEVGGCDKSANHVDRL